VLAGRQPASASQMASMLGSLGKAAVPPSMARLEPQIDASGQDLFAWVKLKGFAAAAASKLPMELAGALPGNLLEHADAVAFGTGSVDGHGRIRVAFSAPGARLLGYLAPKLDTGGLDAAGKLRWVFTLALPDADQLGQFEKSLNLNLGAKGARIYRTLLARLKTAGVPGPHRLATLLGPELVSFGDAGGTYTALRVRDIAAFHAELANLARRLAWKTGVSRSGDARVHWLSAPSLLSAQARKNRSSAGDTMSRTLASIYMQRRVHLYWTEEGHWLVFAPVPQALADRAAIGAHTPVSGWLRKQDYPASTWMGATAISHGAQRDAYYHYIEALQFLGDMLDQPVDVMKLPSARALGLPEDGVIAGGFTITPDTAGLQLDYQQSPGELLRGGHSTSAVAIVAILAAIAIPQYQDYVTKAKFSEAMTIADGLKTPVAEYVARHGRCPGNGEGGIAAPAGYVGRYVASARVGGHAPHCTITARFKNAPAVPAALAGKRVVFTTSRHGNGTSWTCRAPAVADKYLPLACRQPR
jgi:type II secretory pathway pseudopilin PulG